MRTALSTRLRKYAALLGLCLFITPTGFAATPAPPVDSQTLVHNTVDRFLRKETRGLPGQVSYLIGSLDPRTQLSPCPVAEAFLPNGSRLWGNTTIGVRCQVPNGWTIYVGAQIVVQGIYYVSARPLQQGQTLGGGDLVSQTGDLAALPSGIVTDLQEALGKVVKNSISAGQLMRLDMLSAPLVIKQGQSVRLIASGNGFSVTGDGIALSNAAEGQTVQVRTPAGTTVSGKARAGGNVEVSVF